MAKSNSSTKTEIDILHQIIEIMSISNNLNDLVQQISRLLAEKLNGDSCFVYIIDHKILKLMGAWPPHPTQVGKLKLETG
ncbi:MAG: hypothetical protein NT145_00590, partial [Elusimicrobia bacterium]|nr:hypothetical protein [Elusimicrobiota bacterium]